MYNSIPDILRKKSIESLFKTNTFTNCWAIWKPEINRILSPTYSSNDIIDLGDQLTEIFRTTSTSGRGQSSLSTSGAAWESLVCWYLNLCTVGSRIVAIRKMSLVPGPIRDAMTVNYANFKCNTESDITVIVFPDLTEFTNDVNSLTVLDHSSVPIPPIIRSKFNPNLLEFLVDRNFSQFEVGIVQCKTNWNDNSQIPMLWDMVYSAGGFRGRNITIGKNNYSIQNVNSFTYSFITVPTNQNTVFNSNQVSVKRVTNLSGGNYWGQPSLQGVVKSVKEIFTNNFTSNSRIQIRTSLGNAIPNFQSNNPLDYFNLH